MRLSIRQLSHNSQQKETEPKLWKEEYAIPHDNSKTQTLKKLETNEAYLSNLHKLIIIVMTIEERLLAKNL